MSLVIPKPPELVPFDYFVEVAKGNIDGSGQSSVQARNPDVSTGTPEDIWDLGGDFIFPTTGEQWEVLSDSADDSSTGVGAQTLTLQYLDVNYVEQEESIILDGLTPVPFLAINMYRPIKLAVSAVGSSAFNVGTITVRVVGGGDDRIGISPDSNRSLHGLYTVPAGKTAYLVYAYSTIQKNKDANISLFLTDGPTGIFRRALPVEIYQNVLAIKTTIPIKVKEKSDIRLRCTTQNNNTDVSAFMQFLLVDNEVL